MQKYRSLARILFIISFWISVCLVNFTPGSVNPYAQVACPSPIFTAQTPMPAGGLPRPIVAADFDGNGRPDLAIGNTLSIFGGVFSHNITILLNNGVGGFSAGPGSPINISQAPISLATADFNNDGKADLAAAIEQSKTVMILLGDGTGGFNNALTPITFPTAPTYVLATDLDGDLKIDLAVTQADGHSVSILRGNGTGNFTIAAGSPITVGTKPFFVASGQFNGDTQPDLAVANLDSKNVTILLNAGSGRFNQAPGSPINVQGQAYAVVATDFNGDAKIDLAVKNTLPGQLNSPIGYLSVLLGNGNGGFTLREPGPGEVPQPANIGFFGYIVPSDFDKDNKSDLVVANPSPTNPNGSEITIWYGNGNGGFRGRQQYNTLLNPYAIALADFDNSGTKDLAVTFESPEKVVVYLVSCGAAVNTPPTITPEPPLTRQQGSVGTVSPIAMVNDTETPRGSLTVTATTLPDGPSISNIINTNGTITANVAASCNTRTGPNTVMLTVADASHVVTTANLTVNVTANSSPKLGSYAPTSLNVGTGTNVLPTTPPMDNGFILSMTAVASPGFTGTLNVNKTTGVVTIANAGPVGTYSVTVTATDDCGSIATQTFMLTVNPPPNTAPGITPGQALERRQGSPGVQAKIADVNDLETPAGTLIVTTNMPSGIMINSITNTNGMVVATVAAGCSAAVGANIVQLTVTDGGGLKSTANLTVNVAANTPPSLTYGDQQPINVGGSLTVNPVAAPADNGSIVSINLQSVTPAFNGNFAVSASGIVSVTNASPQGNYTVTIRANDNCGASTDATFVLKVGCPAIALNPATLPPGATGVAYNQTITQTGGAGTSTFSLGAGTLPPGLTLTSAGILSGTPTQSGSFTFTVKATDATGCSGMREYSLAINCSAVSVGPANLPKGSVGSAYNQSLQASGGNPPYTFSVVSGNFPSGLSLSSSGAISGTPTQAGTFNVTIKAPDVTGCATQLQIQLVIDPRLATSVSSASYVEGILTPDMIAAVFGTNMATTTLEATTTPLPTDLGGTMVKVRDALAMERPAPLFFVSPNQINYLIPTDTAQGAARATITSGDGAVSVSDFMIGTVMPGVYSANASGRGLAAATVLRIKGDETRSFEPVARFDPVQNMFVPVPIDLGPPTDRVFLVLFGTGIRYRSALSAVTVTIGGMNSEVFYAGQQGNLVGLDQVNSLIPRSLIERGLVDVVLKVDSLTANIVQVSIK